MGQHLPGVGLERSRPSMCILNLFIVWVLATATLAPNPVTQGVSTPVFKPEIRITTRGAWRAGNTHGKISGIT